MKDQQIIQKIDGKVLLFTDLHLGLQNNSISKLSIAVKAVKEIISYIKSQNIKNVIFLGDWNHSRVTTENNVLNVSYKLMSALQANAKVKMIVGNHDIYMKNSVDVNSLVIFKDLPNVEIIDDVRQMCINGKSTLAVPWLGDVSLFPKESFDMMFGHFDVTSKYLIKSYIEDHKNALPASQNDAGDFVGDFIDVIKKNGVVFSGHIHGRREFLAKQRKFLFVGSPYQQNLGEIGNKCGFYVLNEDSTYEFHEIESTPKHIKVVISDVINQGVDSYDFTQVKGNIIQKVYDVEIDRKDDAKISQKIIDMKPHEELLPEYAISISVSSDNDAETSKSIELLKKSKLEYIQNYIDNIDEAALDSDVTKKELFDTLEKYYDAVTEG